MFYWMRSIPIALCFYYYGWRWTQYSSVSMLLLSSTRSIQHQYGQITPTSWRQITRRVTKVVILLHMTSSKGQVSLQMFLPELQRLPRPASMETSSVQDLFNDGPWRFLLFPVKSFSFMDVVLVQGCWSLGKYSWLVWSTIYACCHDH